MVVAVFCAICLIGCLGGAWDVVLYGVELRKVRE